jgi:hypothetical protein
MGIHADSWIRRMAREHRMIEPFEESLTRQNSGGPVISYGLSSYGYDLRVADEFKVFTNVFNAVVDPKAFASHLSRSDGAVRNQLCKSRREIPGATRHHGSADMICRHSAARTEFKNRYPIAYEGPDSQFILSNGRMPTRGKVEVATAESNYSLSCRR